MKIIDKGTLKLDVKRHKGPARVYPYADEEIARKTQFPYSYEAPRYVEVQEGDYFVVVRVVGSVLGDVEWVTLGCRPATEEEIQSATEEEIQSAKEQETSKPPGAKVKSPWWLKLKRFFRPKKNDPKIPTAKVAE